MSVFKKWFGHIQKTKDYVVGIDWMKPYWLAVEICNGEIVTRKLSKIHEIDRYKNAKAVLIDIPIGLSESVEENANRPDREARNLLPTLRKSTIFPVPCRQAIKMATYADSKIENQHILGKSLPSQSFAFSKMILQVDNFLEANPEWKNRLMESHPEVAFQMLNHGRGLQYSKHTEAGIAERVGILQNYGVDTNALLKDYSVKRHEDVLDALCLAVSAQQGCENGFFTLPNNPVCDSHGLKMQMVFGKVKR